MDKQKIVFITGATGGIGKAVAIALAKKNYHIVIHGRSKEKTYKACEEIKSISGNKNGYGIAFLFIFPFKPSYIRYKCFKQWYADRICFQTLRPFRYWHYTDLR